MLIYDNFLEPRFQNEPDIDIATREQICRDIASTNRYREDGYYPYEEKNCGCLSWLCFSYDYPIQQIVVSFFGGKPYKEYVFECLMRTNLTWLPTKVYISEEYNLNVDSTTSDHYIAGRFVFYLSTILKEFHLHNLVEAPANPTISPDSNIEHVYLQRRAKYRIRKFYCTPEKFANNFLNVEYCSCYS